MATCGKLSPPPLRSPLLAATLLFTLLAAGCGREVDTDQPLVVTIGGRPFELELALTPDARFQGLSDRPSLPADHGMLFVFPQARPVAFVMRRCHFPIDVIFLSPNGRIVNMHAMRTVPLDTPEGDLPLHPSGYPAQFAIELNGGMIQQLGLEAGQTIDLPLEALKQLAQ